MIRAALLALLVIGEICATSYLAKEIETYTDLSDPMTAEERSLLSSLIEKCIPPLGCFRIDGVWATRGLNLLPADRSVVNTQFLLFTRKNPTTAQILVAEQTDTIKRSNFDGSKNTIFIIHGFLEGTNVEWFPRFNGELLKQGNYNVINVNWGDLGGSKTLYTQATANTRVVGAEIALLINALIAETGTTVANIHVIGHSLGAHTAGYVGQRVKDLARITGLDPAEPYFEGLSTEIRLDPSDAVFVDIIHTDGDSILNAPLGKGGLGIRQPSGHADFYPNGGETQPNCQHNIGDVFTNVKGLYEGAKSLVACDHQRAVDLFISSINYCPLNGYACSNFADFTSAKCSLSCSAADFKSDKCNLMGLYAHKPQAPQVSYYLYTSGNEPYCATNYIVKVDMDPTSTPRKGKISVNLKGKSSTSGWILLNTDTKEFEAGRSYSFLVGSPSELGEIMGVDIKWQFEGDWWKIISNACFGLKICSADIKVKQISVKTENESSFSYCSTSKVLPNDAVMMLSKAASC